MVVSIKKICQTLSKTVFDKTVFDKTVFDKTVFDKTVFDHISKHLELRQKCSVARPIFNSHLRVWNGSQTQSYVFEILLHCLDNVLIACDVFPFLLCIPCTHLFP